MRVYLKSILQRLDPFKGFARAILPKFALSPMEQGWKALQAQRIASEPDRIYLRDVIVPQIVKSGATRVLFVGVRAYTTELLHLMGRMGLEIWTTDIDPEAARFVPDCLPNGRHILADITAHPPDALPDRFDIVIMNGVFGYGVNTQAQCAAAFGHIVGMLADGGRVLIGWNPERCPDLGGLAGDAGLKPCDFVECSGHKAFCDSTHVFDLYRTNG